AVDCGIRLARVHSPSTHVPLGTWGHARGRTGALITTLRLPVPTQDVLYAKGKLWATPHTERSPFNKTLLEIDPLTRRNRRIAVPGSFDTIFQGGGYIWVPVRTTSIA
ncbi:MAG TPA: hypothetical protein VFJ24_01440, partial [Gaiellales bacterium]|nr:hypothetical protein [Gaiellales bacterium]